MSMGLTCGVNYLIQLHLGILKIDIFLLRSLGISIANHVIAPQLPMVLVDVLIPLISLPQLCSSLLSYHRRLHAIPLAPSQSPLLRLIMTPGSKAGPGSYFQCPSMVSQSLLQSQASLSKRWGHGWSDPGAPGPHLVGLAIDAAYLVPQSSFLEFGFQHFSGVFGSFSLVVCKVLWPLFPSFKAPRWSHRQLPMTISPYLNY